MYVRRIFVLLKLFFQFLILTTRKKLGEHLIFQLEAGLETKKNRQTIADTLLPHLISQVFDLYYFSVYHPECPEATRRSLDFSL